MALVSWWMGQKAGVFNMSIPYISIVASAINIDKWMKYYDSLTLENDIPFEVVMVGPVRPGYVLPSNMKHIYSETKPPQCWEIGARSSSGEYIMPTADDITVSPQFLNKVCQHIENMDSDKYFVGCRYICDGENMDRLMFYNWKRKNSPPNSLNPSIKREWWEQIGGIDKNFIGVYWDIDLHMKLYGIGKELFMAQDCIVYEDRGNRSSDWLCDACAKIDRDFLDSCWVKSKKEYYQNRAVAVESFSDENIVLQNQGRHKEWDDIKNNK